MCGDLLKKWYKEGDRGHIQIYTIYMYIIKMTWFLHFFNQQPSKMKRLTCKKKKQQENQCLLWKAVFSLRSTSCMSSGCPFFNCDSTISLGLSTPGSTACLRQIRRVSKKESIQFIYEKAPLRRLAIEISVLHFQYTFSSIIL